MIHISPEEEARIQKYIDAAVGYIKYKTEEELGVFVKELHIDIDIYKAAGEGDAESLWKEVDIADIVDCLEPCPDDDVPPWDR